MEAKKKKTWKLIAGFDNYEVSDSGKIRKKARIAIAKNTKKETYYKARLMKQRWNKTCKTYFLDLIHNEGKRKTVYPHKEVAKAFCINDNSETKTKIIHLDNKSRNNKASNLEWATPSEHMAFQFKVGNKDNFKVWKTRKKKYKNGFKKNNETIEEAV